MTKTMKAETPAATTHVGGARQRMGEAGRTTPARPFTRPPKRSPFLRTRMKAGRIAAPTLLFILSFFPVVPTAAAETDSCNEIADCPEAFVGIPTVDALPLSCVQSNTYLNFVCQSTGTSTTYTYLGSYYVNSSWGGEGAPNWGTNGPCEDNGAEDYKANLKPSIVAAGISSIWNSHADGNCWWKLYEQPGQVGHLRTCKWTYLWMRNSYHPDCEYVGDAANDKTKSAGLW